MYHFVQPKYEFKICMQTFTRAIWYTFNVQYSVISLTCKKYIYTTSGKKTNLTQKIQIASFPNLSQANVTLL